MIKWIYKNLNKLKADKQDVQIVWGRSYPQLNLYSKLIWVLNKKIFFQY
jgi:hypothetical protein